VAAAARSHLGSGRRGTLPSHNATGRQTPLRNSCNMLQWLQHRGSAGPGGGCCRAAAHSPAPSTARALGGGAGLRWWVMAAAVQAVAVKRL
jgi:hypothetical protein